LLKSYPHTTLITLFFYDDTLMMLKGTVKWSDLNQNYGFIIPDDKTAQNIFIHVSQFKKLGVNSPKNGQRIQFNTNNLNQNSILADISQIFLT